MAWIIMEPWSSEDLNSRRPNAAEPRASTARLLLQSENNNQVAINQTLNIQSITLIRGTSYTLDLNRVTSTV